MIINPAARNTPGIKPAIKRSDIDWEAVTPYMTMGIEGGITTPRPPEEEVTAPAYPLL